MFVFQSLYLVAVLTVCKRVTHLFALFFPDVGILGFFASKCKTGLKEFWSYTLAAFLVTIKLQCPSGHTSDSSSFEATN